MSVLIGIPTSRDIKSQTSAAMIALVKQTNEQNALMMVRNSLVDEARNRIAEEALNYDYLMFIDDDMRFPPDVINRLIARNADIVTCLCFRKTGEHDPCIYRSVVPPIAETDIERDYFEVDGCGSAMLLIKTEVLQNVMEKYGKVWFKKYNGYGEDLSFCYRARKCGYKIYCDATIPIYHIGDEEYGKQHWVRYRQNLKADMCKNYCKMLDNYTDDELAEKCNACPLQKL